MLSTPNEGEHKILNKLYGGNELYVYFMLKIKLNSTTDFL